MAKYSQYAEDQWIIRNLELPEKGVFVEVGAADGIENSNTLRFEEMGWTGILIEPDARQFETLQRNRSKTTCYNCAISSINGDVPFFLNPVPTWSGLNRQGLPTTVNSMRLDTLLWVMPRIDLMSIDTEGTELDVWQSLGNVPKPTIVIMEYYTEGMESQPQLILTQMERDGYKLVHKTICNFVFTLGDRK